MRLSYIRIVRIVGEDYEDLMQGSTLKWKKGGFRKLSDLAALNISQSQKSESDVACLEVQRICQQIVNQF